MTKKIVFLSIVLLIVMFSFGCGKDNIENPTVRSEREKKIGFVFPTTTQWINSVYISGGMDDAWKCKFSIPLGDVNTMFPPSEVTWETDTKPSFFAGKDKWFETDHITKYRAFETRLERIPGVRKRSALNVLIDEQNISETPDESQTVTVYLWWHEF